MRLRPGRPFRRPNPFGDSPRLYGPTRALAGESMRRLDEAQRLFAEGQVATAADIFGELARAAEAARFPKRAAQWHVQAARYYAAAGNAPTALGHARAALGLFAGAGNPAFAFRPFARLIAELRAQGLMAEADTIQGEAQARLGAAPADLQPAPAPDRRLPPECPNCGGAVRSDQVDWIDDHSAACVFCGSVIPAE
jgi:hypothetical protein